MGIRVKFPTSATKCKEDEEGKTREILGSMGINLDIACEMCGQAMKSISHVLGDYIVAKNFWKLLGISSKHHDFFLLDLEEWMRVNYSSNSISKHHQLSWKIVFPFGLWQLWNQRNSFLFSASTITRNIQNICIKKSAEFFAVVGDKPNKHPIVNIQVKWNKPPVGWLKLSTDGSAIGNSGLVGGGELIHNENGDWVMGFARSLDITPGVMAELWALKDSPTLASQLRISSICEDLDAELIFLLLTNYIINNLMLDPLLDDCRTLLWAQRTVGATLFGEYTSVEWTEAEKKRSRHLVLWSRNHDYSTLTWKD